MPRFSFGEPGKSNSERLATYDRLGLNDRRQAQREQEMSDKERKDAFEQAFKLSEAQRKASQFQAKSETADAMMQMRKEHYDALGALKDQRLSQLDQQLEIQKATHELQNQALAAKADTTMKVLDQATNFLKDARGMDPSKPAFDQQFQNLSAAYPMAFEHPSVKEWVGYHKTLRDKFAAADITAAQPPGPHDFGTTSVTSKDATGQTVTTSVPNPDAQKALLAQHSILEGQLNATKGTPDPALVGQLNAVKSQLGFNLLNPSTGQVVVPATPTPITAPATSTVPATAPATPIVPATPAVAAVVAAPVTAKLQSPTDEILKSARAAIAGGKSPDAVSARLKDSGYDPAGL